MVYLTSPSIHTICTKSHNVLLVRYIRTYYNYFFNCTYNTISTRSLESSSIQVFLHDEEEPHFLSLVSFAFLRSEMSIALPFLRNINLVSAQPWIQSCACRWLIYGTNSWSWRFWYIQFFLCFLGWEIMSSKSSWSLAEMFSEQLMQPRTSWGYNLYVFHYFFFLHMITIRSFIYQVLYYSFVVSHNNFTGFFFVHLYILKGNMRTW